MNHYSFWQKSISIAVLSTFFAMITSIGSVNAAAVVAEVTPIVSPSNNTTPNYIFNTSTGGTIAYSGPCSSVTTLAVSGDNTIALNSLAEGTYTTCSLTIDDGDGLSNVLTFSSFIIDATAPVVTLSGEVNLTIFS